MNRNRNQPTRTETFEADEAARWRAVQKKDCRCDGAFVYAVRSTRIYCRPCCPARRPHRKQVRFFDSVEAAAQSGFRPCKRCRPDSLTYANRRVKRVEVACRQIERGHQERTAGTALSLHALSRQANSSPHHFHRTFKQVTGVTPRQYADASRLSHLKARLQDGETVTGALYEAGYGSSRGLYEGASAQLGMTPARYRRGGPGVSIRFTTAPCSLGYLLVAATERGLCSVSLGDSQEALEAALRQEFHAARLQQDEAGLEVWLQAVLQCLEGRQPHPDLPLDVQATAFQRRVWQALRSIPLGETRTYSQIAEAIGAPQAVRAVARACATNSIAIAIPCHRAVRRDGSPGGYRWGLERKQKLLQQEATNREAMNREAQRTDDSEVAK